jgi:hypothetical protein
MSKLSVFDLREHGTQDLTSLLLAVEHTLQVCGGEGMKRTRESLLAYQSIVNQALDIAIKRQAEQEVSMERDRLAKLN